MRHSAMARLGVMGLLTVALLIPLMMVQATVSERAARRDEAVREISATWGAPQTIGGPILSVPYRSTWTDASGKVQQASHRLHLLPSALQVRGRVVPERRRRGIFEAVVYRTTLDVSGTFIRPDFAQVEIAPNAVEWDRATVSVGVTDPKGVGTRGLLTWRGSRVPFMAHVADVGLVAAGIQATAPGLAELPAGTPVPFAFQLDVGGTRSLHFLPAGDETTVELTSDWPHPSFNGAPLPQTRSADQSGFSARWTVTDLGRAYPGRWTTVGLDKAALAARAEASAFGVTLLTPVDIYQQAERAVKYAVLFIVLTFMIFFLWEVFQATLLHPVQYLFVGFALCLFYLLLVSLSEHIGFDTAYLLSSSAAMLVIGGYSRAVLQGSRQALSVVLSLAGLYGFLFLLLRLEDYALVAGAIGLFAILAFVMFITRRFDWYELRLHTSDTHQ